MRRNIAVLLTAALVLAAPGQPCYAALGRLAAGAAAAPAVPGAAGAAKFGVSPLSLDAFGSPLNAAALNPVLPGMENAALATPPPGIIPVGVIESAKTPAPRTAYLPDPRRKRSDTLGKDLKHLAQDAAPYLQTTVEPSASPGALHAAGTELQGLLRGIFTLERNTDGVAPSADGLLRGRRRGLQAQSGLLRSRPGSGARRFAADIPDYGSTAAQTTLKNIPAMTRIMAAFGRALRGLKRIASRSAVAAAVLLTLTLAAPAYSGVQLDILGNKAAQTVAQTTSPAPAAVDAAQKGEEAAAEEKFIQAEVEAAVSVSPQNVTVGEGMELTITLRSTGGEKITVPSLRAALEANLPFALELLGRTGSEAFDLAPGETKTFVFKVVPFDAGEIKIEGVKIRISGADGGIPTVIVIPDAVLKVESVLTPDWKMKGFKDIAEIQRGENPNLAWLLSIPLGLLMLIGVERLLAARREGRKPKVFLKPLWETTQKRIAALEERNADLDSAPFYAELFSILDAFLIDLHGLEKRERAADELIHDARRSGKYSYEQISLARRLADTAEAVRFGGRADDADLRRKSLIALRALAEELLAPKDKTDVPESAPSLMGLGALFGGGAAALSFGQPWALLLIVPLGIYLIWKMYRGKSNAFQVSSAKTLPGRKTLRQRLRWMPGALRVAAVTLLLLALSQPRVGVERQETYVPSTDTVMSIDLSGSMDTKFGAGEKVSQLQAARDAVKAYVVEQRRGTTNRVGMVTFTEDSYLDVRLTTDYDALIAHLKEIDTSGSTAVGKSILASITHFLEVNAYELNDPEDPRIRKIQALLDKKGLAEALDYAKKHTDLMRRILQPDRTKIIVLFTDGGSNTGLSMADAAEIARQLGIRIYTVGINTSGNDKTNLEGMSEATGGLYFQVGDAEGMRAALLDISRLERSPSLVKSKIATKDFGNYLLLLALLMIGMEVTLSSTKLRGLSGMALLLGMSLVLPNGQVIDAAKFAQSRPAIVAAAVEESPAQAPRGIIDRLPLSKMPRELEEANTLYFQKRYDEAVKKYSEALQRYPDIPEIYFNTANAFLRRGDAERASKYYQEYLRFVKGDKAKESKTFYNLGNAALMQKDLGRAIDLYREALRRDAGSPEAKWNLEVAMKMLKQQKQQQGKGKPGKGKPGDGKPGDGKPGDGKPGDGKPGDGKPGDGKPGDKKAVDGNKSKEAERAEGIDKLQKEQGEVEKESDAKSRDAAPKKGSGVWGLGLLPLAAIGPAAIGFANPLLLWAVLVLAPVAAGFLIYSVRKKIKAARALSPLDAPKSFKQWSGRGRWTAKFSMIIASLVLFAFAAGDPIFGEKDTRLNFGGKDILMTTDVSYSMLGAEDGRLDRTKAELMDFIRRMEGTDRVGLIVFAGKARTASPLSIDYANFEFKMRRLEREARGLGGGSDLTAAIEHTVKSFETAKKIGDRERILIVISDGDIFGQELEKAIKLARDKGITIYTIGVGGTEGTKIVLPQSAEGGETQHVIDEKTGQPAITRLNEDNLRKLAQSTGGAYFRAGNDSGISKLLSRVAEMQKGTEKESVKSPRKIAPLFLWPGLALLLLELLLPDIPLLKKRTRGTQPAPGAAKLNGAMLLGFAIPLSVWPQILPFAALVTVFAGLVLYDLLSRGALSRRVLAWTQRGEPAAGLERDLGVLYDSPETGRERFREKDLAELRSFLAGWGAAKDGEKTRLINEALADKDLWRQKLTAAYLAEHIRPAKDSAQTSDSLLGALATASRTHLTRLEPVLKRLVERRRELAWLNHPKALRALSRLAAQSLDPAHADSRAVLESLAAEPDAVVRQTATESLAGVRAPPRRTSTLKRVGVAATTLLLAALLALTSVSGVRTVEFSALQTQAAQTQLSIFFGDDLYVLTDQYADARIKDEVVPVLKRWNRTGAAAQADLERAVAVLRSSPDPKSDNVLEALFKHADMLPMSTDGETLLLKTLIERDNDQVWGFLKRYMQENAENPAATGRLLRMIKIGAEVGSERVFNNLFFFLTSPNDQVRSLARAEIGKSLSDPARGEEFVERLKSVSAHHAEKPLLQLWVEFFALERLSAPGAEEMPISEVHALIKHVLSTSQKFDKHRLEAIKQIKPGEEDKLPPALQEQAFGIMLNHLKNAGGAVGAVPAPLAQTVQKSIHEQTTALIKEALTQFPGLKEKLQTQGVLLADPPPTVVDDYDDYDDYGFGGRGIHGGKSGTHTYVDPDKKYRTHYKLSHLRELRSALQESAANAMGMNGPSRLKPEQREFIDRAMRILAQLTPAAEMAGVLEGGSVGEAAAAEINKVLVEGNSEFAGDHFARKLRAEGLAPNANMPVSEGEGLRRSYGDEDIAGIRALLDGIVASGEAWEANGTKRELNWGEKKYLAGAIDSIEAIRAKHYPGTGTQAVRSATTVIEQATALQDALNSGDDAAIARAEKALRASYDRAANKDIFLAQLVAAQGKLGVSPHAGGRLGLWTMRFIAERYAAGADFDSEGLKEALGNAFKTARDAGKPAPAEAETWSTLKTALNTMKKSGRPVPEGVSTMATEALNERGKRLVAEAAEAFGVDGPAGERLREKLADTYIVKADGKTRESFKLYHLRELTEAIDSAAKLKPEQAKFAKRSESLLKTMTAAAEAAGLPDGGSAGERLAEELNDVLHEGYIKFPGTHFNDMLRSAKLAPQGGSNALDGAYFGSYTAQDLLKIRQFYDDMLRSGKYSESSGALIDLLEAHKLHLVSGLDRIERMIEKFYPDMLGSISSKSPGKLMKTLPGTDARTRAAYAAAPLLAAASIPEVFQMGLLGIGWPVLLGAAALLALGVFVAARVLKKTAAVRGTDAEGRSEVSEDVIKRYKRLEIHARKMASAVTGGQFRSKLVGPSGSDFVELAAYHNEDRKAINWKASAKRDELQVNRFEQHKEMPLMLLIDISDSSVFGTRGADKKTVIEDVAATLALMASHLNVRVGALFFTDRVEEYIPPKGGKRHAWHIVRRLLAARPEGRGTDLGVPLDFTLKRMRARAMVAMVSDFLAPDYAKAMRALTERHDLRAIRVTDPAEPRPLPDVGLLRVTDAETGEERWVDTSSRAGHAEQLAKIRRRERDIEDAFHAARTRPITLSTEGEYIEDLAKEFIGKRK